VSLSLRAGTQPIGLVLAGLALAVIAAASWATRTATSEPIVTPLRAE
jgi:hypothetical protein